MKRVLVLLALLCLALPSPASAGGGMGVLRRPAPNFTLTDLSGERVSLADLRGEAVIVQFSGLECGVCRENDRLLRGYQFEYLSHGLVVVSLYGQDSLDEVRRYDADFAFSTLTGLDPGQTVARQYQASAIPTTVLIDRDGFIRAVLRGRLTEEELLRWLQQFL